MTKLEILDILHKIYGIEVYLDTSSKFSVIDIPGTGIRFFTYSEDTSSSDCIWYCSIWIVNEAKEVKIPNEMSKEFLEEIYDYTKVLNKINDKVSQIKKRLNEMNSQDAIRDMKLKTILK